VLNICAGLGIEMTRRVFTMDFQTAIALVSVGEGVAIVPQSVGSVQRTGVRFHEITNPLAQTGVSVNHRLDEQGVHVRNFVAIAQKVARKTF
jgi:LysR family transcriptional regulator, benzoate and cis,cis-muconate-responsive activator of ben and cat genes